MSEGGEESRKPQRIKQTQPKRPREPEAEEDEPAGGAGGVQEQGRAPGREWANGGPRKRKATDFFVNHENMTTLYGEGPPRESYNLPTKKGKQPGEPGFFREDTVPGVLQWEVLKDKRTRTTQAPAFEDAPSGDEADRDFREGDARPYSESEEEDDTVSDGGTRTRTSGGPAKKKKQRDARPGKKIKNKRAQPYRVRAADESSNATLSEDSERDEEEEEQQPRSFSKAKPMLETGQARVQSVLNNVRHGYGIFVFAAPQPGDKEGKMCKTYLKYRANIQTGEAYKRDHVSWLRLIKGLPEAVTADPASIWEAIGILTRLNSEIIAEIADLATGKDFKGPVVFPGQGRINHVYAREIFLAAMAHIANMGCEFPRTQELVLAALRVIGNQDEFKTLARSIRPGKGVHKETIPDDLKRFKTVTKLFDRENPLVGELSDLYTDNIPTDPDRRAERITLGGMLLSTGRITQVKLEELKQKEVQECMRQMAMNMYTEHDSISTKALTAALKQEGRFTAAMEKELGEVVNVAKDMQVEFLQTKDRRSVERKFKKSFEDLYKYLPFLQKIMETAESHPSDIAGPAAAPAAPVHTEESEEEPDVSEREELMTQLLMKPQLWGITRYAYMAAHELEAQYTAKREAKKGKVLTEYKQSLVQAFLMDKTFKLPRGDDAAQDFSPILETVARDLKEVALEYIAKQLKNIPENQRQPSEVLQCVILQGWEFACQCKGDGEYTKGTSVPNGEGFVLDMDVSADRDGAKWLKDFFGYIGSMLTQQGSSKLLEARHFTGTVFADAGETLQYLLDNTEIDRLDPERVIRDALVFIADIAGRGDIEGFTSALNEYLDVPVSSYIKKQEVIVIMEDDEPAAGGAATAQVVENGGKRVLIKPRSLRVPERLSVTEYIVNEVKQLMTQNDVRLEGAEWDELLKTTTLTHVAMTKFRILNRDSIGEGKYTDLSDGIKTVFRFSTADAGVYHIFAESDKKDDVDERFKCFCMEIACSAQRVRGGKFSQTAWLAKVRRLFPKKKD